MGLREIGEKLFKKIVGNLDILEEGFEVKNYYLVFANGEKTLKVFLIKGSFETFISVGNIEQQETYAFSKVVDLLGAASGEEVLFLKKRRMEMIVLFKKYLEDRRKEKMLVFMEKYISFSDFKILENHPKALKISVSLTIDGEKDLLIASFFGEKLERYKFAPNERLVGPQLIGKKLAGLIREGERGSQNFEYSNKFTFEGKYLLSQFVWRKIQREKSFQLSQLFKV